MSNIIIFILFSIIAIFMFIILAFILSSCKVSGDISKEEDIRKLEGQEYKLDDSNWQDELVYDEDFVKKEDVNGKRDNLGK